MLRVNLIKPLFGLAFCLVSLPAMAGDGAPDMPVSLATRCELTPFDATVISPALDMMNSERAAKGMGTLTEDPALSEAASAQAADMARRGVLTHTDAAGQAFVQRAVRAQYSGQPRAENLAWHQKSAAHAAAAWLASPAHRDNIMMPEVDEVGFGYACDPKTGRFWVMVLGRRTQAILGAK